MSQPLIRIAVMLVTVLCCCGGLLAEPNSIVVDWEPVPEAAGYSVHYGTESGEYTSVIDAGTSTEVVLKGLDPCLRYFIAVTTRDAQGRVSPFSNEISGGTRPHISSVKPSRIVQGLSRVPIDIRGGTFIPGAEITLVPDSVPRDADGQPLITLEGAEVVNCRRIEALLSIEPAGRGLRAMATGEMAVEIQVVNPNSVYGSDTARITIDLDSKRADVNRVHPTTRGRVDGRDLSWIAYAFSTRDGEPRFNPDADVDGNGLVDGADLAEMSAVFGHCWTSEGWALDACRGRYQDLE